MIISCFCLLYRSLSFPYMFFIDGVVPAGGRGQNVGILADRQRRRKVRQRVSPPRSCPSFYAHAPLRLHAAAACDAIMTPPPPNTTAICYNNPLQLYISCALPSSHTLQ